MNAFSRSNILIAFEGNNASGKRTQAQLLSQALTREKRIAKVFDFPDKGSTGRFLRYALNGEFGDFSSLHPRLACAIFSLDRSAAREKIDKALKRGIVICNRYTASNIAFQAVKIPEGDERQKFIEDIERIEYVELGLPKATMTIHLDMPLHLAGELLDKRGKRDSHEKDEEYQVRVQEMYRELVENSNDWHNINCAPGGDLLPPAEIHLKVMAVVNSLLIDPSL